MGKLTITDVNAIPLTVLWEDLYGGIENVPSSLLRPSSNFQGIPRRGQFSTIVQVTDSSGCIGIGEAWGLPHSGVSALIINDLFRPIAVGWEADDIDGLWKALTIAAEGIGHTRGFMMEAISGLDMALWDLRGKRMGKPVYELIGGRVRDRVACYASPIRFNDDTQDTIENAQEFIDAGFTAVKVKAGRSVEKDVAYIAAIREALGPNIRIMVDVNCGWDIERTILFARAVEPYNIYWIEEPIPPDHPDELAELRRAVNIRISTGENDYTVAQFNQLLKKEAVDVLTPNITRCGGITGLLRIQQLAETNGVDIALHGVGSGIMLAAALHTMSTFSNGVCMEYNRFPNPLRETLVSPKASFHNSYLEVPAGPGLGISLLEDVVNRFRN